ncbi:hypothetical protein EBZ35_06505 [bacterium]|nr:hypothetical protein [bacterium]
MRWWEALYAPPLTAWVGAQRVMGGPQLVALPYPTMIGTSQKSWLATLTRDTSQDRLGEGPACDGPPPKGWRLGP